MVVCSRSIVVAAPAMKRAVAVRREDVAAVATAKAFLLWFGREDETANGTKAADRQMQNAKRSATNRADKQQAIFCSCVELSRFQQE